MTDFAAITRLAKPRSRVGDVLAKICSRRLGPLNGRS